MKEKIEKIIKKAGEIMISANSKDFYVSEEKGKGNFVTEFDVKVQRFLEEELKKLFPEASFLAEEDGEDKNEVGEGLTFIIDPIDGTANFAFGANLSTISLALAKDGRVIMGAVYNPYTGEYFFAEEGKGATLNGETICVSPLEAAHGIAAFGTAPYYKESLGDETIALFSKVYSAFGDIRRLGTAALDLCNVARGVYSAFFEQSLYPWDYAAAMLIVKEAGGIVSDFSGNEITHFKRTSVLASSKEAYATAISLTK